MSKIVKKTAIDEKKLGRTIVGCRIILIFEKMLKQNFLYAVENYYFQISPLSLLNMIMKITITISC